VSHPKRRIVVVGAGYVGLTTAIGYASLGSKVELVENNPDRLKKLQDGEVPIFEPHLQQAFGRAIADGLIRVQGAITMAAPEIVMLCVGTPVDVDGRVDLTQVHAALEDLRSLPITDAALVIRSTLPVGLIDEIIGWSGHRRSHTFTNPEFLRQGHAFDDFLRPSRIIVGRFEEADRKVLTMVTETVSVSDAPVMVVSVHEADLIKNGSNAFLALKLSFANELSVFCEEVGGADIERVLEGIGRDPRIGSEYLRPSYGFGGSCLPKELKTLAFSGSMLGLPMHVTSAASEANTSHQARFVRRVERSLAGQQRPQVALLGLAFKAGTDDVRFSPALELARQFLEKKISVLGHDPRAAANAVRALPGLRVVDSVEEALRGADATVIATEWPEYAAIDWGAVRQSMRHTLVFDGRRLLDPDAMVGLGYHYETIGIRHEHVAKRPT
jgi:UDPglucose 6-dehydrogenase